MTIARQQRSLKWQRSWVCPKSWETIVHFKWSGTNLTRTSCTLPTKRNTSAILPWRPASSTSPLCCRDNRSKTWAKKQVRPYPSDQDGPRTDNVFVGQCFYGFKSLDHTNAEHSAEFGAWLPDDAIDAVKLWLAAHSKSIQASLLWHLLFSLNAQHVNHQQRCWRVPSFKPASSTTVTPGPSFLSACFSVHIVLIRLLRLVCRLSPVLRGLQNASGSLGSAQWPQTYRIRREQPHCNGIHCILASACILASGCEQPCWTFET